MRKRYATLLCGAALLTVTAAQAQDACPNRGQLDTLYCDADRDLVADAPKDPAKWRDPSAPRLGLHAGRGSGRLCQHLQAFHRPSAALHRQAHGLLSGAVECGRDRGDALRPASFLPVSRRARPASPSILLARVPFAAKGLGSDVRGYNLIAIVKASSPYQKLSDLKDKKWRMPRLRRTRAISRRACSFPSKASGPTRITSR